MLAKDKLEQLKNNIDHKIINGIDLEMVDFKEIEKDKMPKEVDVVKENHLIKIYKTRDESPTYYCLKKVKIDKWTDAIRAYQVTLVEDYDEYYDEIMSILKKTPMNKTLNNTSKSSTEDYIRLVAYLIVGIGVIGGVASMDGIPEIGFALIISSLPLAAILFGIAKIIELLNK